jgi:hypothetical protein
MKEKEKRSEHSLFISRTREKLKLNEKRERKEKANYYRGLMESGDVVVNPKKKPFKDKGKDIFTVETYMF